MPCSTHSTWSITHPGISAANKSVVNAFIVHLYTEQRAKTTIFDCSRSPYQLARNLPENQITGSTIVTKSCQGGGDLVQCTCREPRVLNAGSGSECSVCNSPCSVLVTKSRQGDGDLGQRFCREPLILYDVSGGELFVCGGECSLRVAELG